MGLVLAVISFAWWILWDLTDCCKVVSTISTIVVAWNQHNIAVLQLGGFWKAGGFHLFGAKPWLVGLLLSSGLCWLQGWLLGFPSWGPDVVVLLFWLARLPVFRS